MEVENEEIDETEVETPEAEEQGNNDDDEKKSLQDGINAERRKRKEAEKKAKKLEAEIQALKEKDSKPEKSALDTLIESGIDETVAKSVMKAIDSNKTDTSKLEKELADIRFERDLTAKSREEGFDDILDYADEIKDLVDKGLTIEQSYYATVGTKTKQVIYGDRYGALPEATPYDSKYKFEGWYLEREFKNQITENSIVNVTKDTTVYAKYVREDSKEFKVTFDYNYPVDHAPKTEVKEYNNGERYGNMPEPEEVGEWVFSIFGTYYRIYEFVEWNTRPDGRGTTITSNTIVNLDDDITLYAIWKQKSTMWQ